MAAWYQDDWRVSQRLTLNLGVRWDADLGVMGEKKKLLPWMSGNRPHQLDWLQPRVGFAYSFDDRTVLRGGYGVYYTQLENDAAHQSNLNIQTIIPEVAYDGRADFPMNPWGGAFPTYDQAQARLCSNALVPGCIRREISSEVPSPVHDDTYSHQTMVGFARQLGATVALEVSYQYTGQRREEVTFNQNLTYDPATGDNIPYSNIATRVYPEWGFVNGEYMQGWSNWHAAGDVGDQAVERPVAVLGQLHLWGRQGLARTSMPDGQGDRPQCRSHVCANHVRAEARRRGRVHACRHRPASSGGRQRHLGRRDAVSS